ncbi:E3 ubiquitin-protein ligase PRT6 [Ananas comosus]|uniref:E3 ubiquitin-protein ligase n=1 Tax=Ananas comosus TaxID=4615 RepID=A0A199UIH4_ANACO|nr:E3 ubiquitin-protein ligase PRT6 [Ananas comosus]
MELNGIRELEDMDEVVRDLALNWCQHFCKEFKARRYRGALFSSPAVSFKLMQLPLVYQDLLQRYVKMHCSECESVPDEPALCLLCGKLCSPNWKSCCRASKCLNHVMVCGAGVGVFLLVRKTTILMQRAARQAFWPSPYLDAFGEENNNIYAMESGRWCGWNVDVSKNVKKTRLKRNFTALSIGPEIDERSVSKLTLLSHAKPLSSRTKPLCTTLLVVCRAFTLTGP